MLRHTFATQLLNAGAQITTLQALMGHAQLNTTMIYARVHDKTVIADYYQAMGKIEGAQTAVLAQETTRQKVQGLLTQLDAGTLSGAQQAVLAEIRRCLAAERGG